MVDFNTMNGVRVKDAVDRYIRQAEKLHVRPPDRQTLTMDLMAADGKNGNPPINWDALLAADGANFAHDIGGIHKHMIRNGKSAGRLGGQFIPRFAATGGDA